MRHRQTSPLALVARTDSQARAAAAALAGKIERDRLRPFSLDRFLASERAPSRIVASAAGKDLRGALDFLRRLRLRALWPPPGADLLEAIAGLRPSTVISTSRFPPHSGAALATALLLEGEVTPERARGALAGTLPRDWIVESARRVRIPAAGLEELRRRGVRFFALEPVEVVALAASPALARARAKWRHLLPAGTPVWVVS